jgi:hypothetical protein
MSRKCLHIILQSIRKRHGTTMLTIALIDTHAHTRTHTHACTHTRTRTDTLSNRVHTLPSNLPTCHLTCRPCRTCLRYLHSFLLWRSCCSCSLPPWPLCPPCHAHHGHCHLNDTSVRVCRCTCACGGACGFMYACLHLWWCVSACVYACGGACGLMYACLHLWWCVSV